MFEKKQYPALEEVEHPLSQEELDVLRRQVESEGEKPNPQSHFNYAWGLVKANDSASQKKGLNILAKLYTDEPSMRRECLYYLALGSYKAGDYGNARRFTDQLLANEPHNDQIKSLKQSLDDKVTQEGLIGLGIAGGLLACGIGIVSAVMRRKK